MQHALSIAGMDLLGNFEIAAAAFASCAAGMLAVFIHHGRGIAVPALTGGAAEWIYDRWIHRAR